MVKNWTLHEMRSMQEYGIHIETCRTDRIDTGMEEWNDGVWNFNAENTLTYRVKPGQEAMLGRWIAGKLRKTVSKVPQEDMSAVRDRQHRPVKAKRAKPFDPFPGYEVEHGEKEVYPNYAADRPLCPVQKMEDADKPYPAWSFKG